MKTKNEQYLAHVMGGPIRKDDADRVKLDLANSHATNYLGYKPKSKELVREGNDIASAVKRQKAASEASKIEKQIANREWYQHNKQWKQDYNKQYYQQNKDYWEKRYKENVQKAHNAEVDKNSAIDYWKDVKEHGFDTDWDSLNLRMNTDQDKANRYRSEANIAKQNYEKAVQEYDWYTRSTARTPVTSLWSAGAKSIVDTGKKALSSFASLFKSGLKSIFG